MHCYEELLGTLERCVLAKCKVVVTFITPFLTIASYYNGILELGVSHYKEAFSPSVSCTSKKFTPMKERSFRPNRIAPFYFVIKYRYHFCICFLF